MSNFKRVLSQQEALVESFSEALRGEFPADGEESGWTVIGGIEFGQTAVVKDPSGERLFTITLNPASPAIAAEYKGMVFPVLVKRPDGETIERLTVDFSRSMAYSNMTDDQTKAATEVLIKSGFLKKA